MKKEMMENATGVKLTKKASKNVIRSLSVGLAAMMALSTPIAAFAEDADGQNSSETTPEESTTTVTTQKSAAEQVGEVQKAAEETRETTKERTMTWFGMHFPLRETAILYLSFIWNHTIRPIQMEPGWMTFYRK